MINTFIFELTDDYINIYNKKTKELISVSINSNIIVKNRIYDYLKLVQILNDIVNKYKVINSIFKTKIVILNFEDSSPSENYLRKNLFKKIINVNAKIINTFETLDDNHIFISGNYSYYKGKTNYNLNKKKYIVNIPFRLIFNKFLILSIEVSSVVFLVGLLNCIEKSSSLDLYIVV